MDYFISFRLPSNESSALTCFLTAMLDRRRLLCNILFRVSIILDQNLYFQLSAESPSPEPLHLIECFLWCCRTEPFVSKKPLFLIWLFFMSRIQFPVSWRTMEFSPCTRCASVQKHWLEEPGRHHADNIPHWM